jgi:hypothetical protein
LDKFDIPLIVKHDLMLAPFSLNPLGSKILMDIAQQFQDGKQEIEIKFEKIENSDADIYEMRKIEELIKNYNALTWLALRYPDQISVEKTKREMNHLIDILSNSLANQTDLNKKKKVEINLQKKKLTSLLGKILSDKKDSISE